MDKNELEEIMPDIFQTQIDYINNKQDILN